MDHDYLATVLIRRYKYTDVNKFLREKKIKFQSPYPAKLRVHYEDGIQTYQNAVEATADMAKWGFPVTIIMGLANKDHSELQILAF